MYNRIPYLIAFIFLINFALKAQVIGVGEWRDHLPYKKAKDVIEIDNKIYCSTESGIVIFNKEDNSLEKLSKINGLSDVDINALAYSKDFKILLIGYSNCNIDIIENNEIENLPDIKRKPITGNKTINSISIIGSKAYMACGFGIVVFNLRKKEIKDTYQILYENNTLNIYDVCIFNNYIYAGTNSGLFKGNIDDNLVDFQNWQHVDNIQNNLYIVNHIEKFKNSLYISQYDEFDTLSTLLNFKNDVWTPLSFTTQKTINSIDTAQDNLIISVNEALYYINKNNIIESEINDYGFYFKPNPKKVITDSENSLWIADAHGLISYDQNQFKRYIPNGPTSNYCYTMKYQNGYLWVTGGGITERHQNLWRPVQFHYFHDEKWKSITFYDKVDAISIVINPKDPTHFFAGSYGGGLVEISNNEIIKKYDISNQNEHTLQSIIPNNPYIRIYGLAFDKYNNLWITNANVNNLINILIRENGAQKEKWIGIPLGSIYENVNIGDIISTKNNYKWITTLRGEGIIVYDDNNTIENLDDDQWKKFQLFDENKKTITTEVFDLIEDDKGDIWVGTDQGVYVIYNPENVFTGEYFYASDILIPRNDGTNSADRLLETESVTCIEIDGANRKWFGTKNSGVYLFSEDGLKQIYNFNINNSPLLSNYITDIEINGLNGEVFFSTSSGLISFKSTAADENLQSNLTYVYPNPVRENYHGPITITGLYKDSNVKITDINGNIVYETTSLGGQAVWDGNTLDGVRVKTGVYLVFCTSKDGMQTKMTKFLVIN